VDLPGRLIFGHRDYVAKVKDDGLHHSRSLPGRHAKHKAT
jgi:hypothetical protein